MMLKKKTKSKESFGDIIYCRKYIYNEHMHLENDLDLDRNIHC